MIIDHMKGVLCTGLKSVKMAARKCHDNGVELVAIVIVTLVVRLTRSPGLYIRRQRMLWPRPLLHVLRGQGRLHATAFVRAAGRMLAPVLFS